MADPCPRCGHEMTYHVVDAVGDTSCSYWEGSEQEGGYCGCEWVPTWTVGDLLALKGIGASLS